MAGVWQQKSSIPSHLDDAKHDASQGWEWKQRVVAKPIDTGVVAWTANRWSRTSCSLPLCALGLISGLDADEGQEDQYSHLRQSGKAWRLRWRRAAPSPIPTSLRWSPKGRGAEYECETCFPCVSGRHPSRRMFALAILGRW